MVQHFIEEHDGMEQDIVFRITRKHKTPLDRQIWESVYIEELSKDPNVCLNLKNEWAGSKIPGLSVLNPKGTLKTKAGGHTSSGEETEGCHCVLDLGEEPTERERLQEDKTDKQGEQQEG